MNDILLLSLCISISSLLILLVLHYYSINSKKEKMLILVIGAFIIVTIYFIIEPNTILSLKLSVILSLLFVMSVTDYRDTEILNINIILMYVSLLTFLIFDQISGNDILYKSGVIITCIVICKVLNKLNLLGEGDNSIIAISIYLFELNTLLVIGIACVSNMIISILRKRTIDFKAEIPIAPGFLISLIAILILIPL